jgi:hypothetical protein
MVRSGLHHLGVILKIIFLWGCCFLLTKGFPGPF